MTGRRIILMLGIYAFLTALFLFADVFYINHQRDTIEVQVSYIEESQVAYRSSKNAEVQYLPSSSPHALYTYKGREKDTVIVPNYCKGLSVKECDALKVGDRVTLYIDPLTGESMASETYFYSAVQAIVSLVLILVGRKSAKGFKSEFIDRHKGAFYYTAAVSAAILVFAVYEEYIYSPYGFMPGLAALGMFVMLIAAMIAAVISEIIVWIVSLVKGKKKQQNISPAANC